MVYDEEIFERILAQRPRLVGFLYKRTRDKELAEQLTDKAIDRAWSSMNNGNKPPCFVWTYMCTIGKNLVKDHIRDTLARAEDQLDETSLKISTHIRTNPEATIHLHEVFSAVDALGSMYSVPFRLHYEHGYTMPEISDIIGVPSQTIKTRLHRTRKRISHLDDSLLEMNPA
jgi:RNA polymerase sigma-70 factor (ECF subfamily)